MKAFVLPHIENDKERSFVLDALVGGQSQNDAIVCLAWRAVDDDIRWETLEAVCRANQWPRP